MLHIKSMKEINASDRPVSYSSFYAEMTDAEGKIVKVAYKKVYKLSDSAIYACARDDFEKLFYIEIKSCETFNTLFYDVLKIRVYDCDVILKADADVIPR